MRILSLEGFDSFNAYLGLFSCRKLVQDWCIWCIDQPQIPENPCNSPLLSLLLVQTLHRGEQQHIPDRLTIGQQHAHSVNAEADAARSWGQRGAFGPSKGRFSGCFSVCSLNPLSSVSCSFPPSNRNWFKNGLKWFKLKSSSAGSRKHLNC